MGMKGKCSVPRSVLSLREGFGETEGQGSSSTRKFSRQLLPFGALYLALLLSYSENLLKLVLAKASDQYVIVDDYGWVTEVSAFA